MKSWEEPTASLKKRAGTALNDFVQEPLRWLWRTIYLAQLPRLDKRMRVALHWTLDLFFPNRSVK